jgi:predicted transcriptional regulator
MSDMSDFGDLLFTLSNDDRLAVLRLLGQGEHRLTEISSRINSTPQETSRNIARLQGDKLIERTPEGPYRITPYGSHVAHFIPGLKFLYQNREYFRHHTLADIPPRLLSRIGELISSTFSDDVMYSFHNVLQMINHAEEYVWIMSNQILMSTIQPLHEAMLRGIEFRLIVPRDLHPPEEFLRHVNSEAWRRHQADVRVREKCNYTVTISEKTALTSFINVDGKLDYFGFRTETKEGHNWCRDLFLEAWEEADKAPSFFMNLKGQIDS